MALQTKLRMFHVCQSMKFFMETACHRFVEGVWGDLSRKASC